MITTTPRPWQRTTSRRPCPLCRGSGCLISSPTGPAAVVCAQMKSRRRIGAAGFLHELRSGPAWAPWCASLARMMKEARGE